MKRFVAVIAFAAALLLAGANFASASPTNVSFTQDKTYVAVNEAVTYTVGPYVCDIKPCTVKWFAFGSGLSRLGTPIGQGDVLVKSWPKVGSWNVQVRVYNAGSTNGYGQFSQYTVVQ